MKRLFMVLAPLIFLIISNIAQAQERKSPTEYPWGGSVYDPRTKTTTSMQVNADGTAKTVVRDEAGKVISEKISYPDDFIVPWAEHHDPETGETTLSEEDYFTGSHVVTKFDREGDVISKRVEHQHISKDEAVEILEGERGCIQWRLNFMDKLYAEYAVETLRSAFLHRGVERENILSYAQSWNAHLLVWVDYGSYFYKDHLNALDASIAHVKRQARVYSGDTAYIVQGVNAWIKIHEKLWSLFEEMINWMAEEARELEEVSGYAEQEFKVEDEYLKRGLQAGDNYDYSKAEKEKEAALIPLREKNKEHTQLAKKALEESQRIREEIVNLSKTRVFSSLSDSQRLEVPEVPEETAEVPAEVPKPVEPPAESPRVETEPVPERAEETAPAEKSERESLEEELSEKKNEFQSIKKELDELTARKIENAFATQALDDVSQERLYQMRSETYGEMAKELAGLKGDELKRAFQRALDEAVNAKKFLYQRPGDPTPSSWPLSVRDDLGKAEKQAYNKSYDRQIAKMGLIMRRLGDDFSERALETQTGYELHKVVKGTVDVARERILKDLSGTATRGIAKVMYIQQLEEQLSELKK